MPSMANDGMIRLKVEGFDAEGCAVPQLGPMLVLLPGLDAVPLHRIVALQEALPAGSIVAAGSGDSAAIELLSHVEDEVLVKEARRRWNRTTFAFGKAEPPEMWGKVMRDTALQVKRGADALGIVISDFDGVADVASRIADRLELSVIAVEDPERAGASDEEAALSELSQALELALDNAPPFAILRAWTSEERETAKKWAWAWFEWAGSGEEGEAPKQPEHVTRAFAFLQNGTLKINGPKLSGAEATMGATS